ncbi:uncharacterized protein METZ01_LOCUS303836, partial [marine metagenome]
YIFNCLFKEQLLKVFWHFFSSVYLKEHKNLQMTQRYAHLHNEALREASEIIDNIDKAY